MFHRLMDKLLRNHLIGYLLKLLLSEFAVDLFHTLLIIFTSNTQTVVFNHHSDTLLRELLNRYCNIPAGAQGSQADFHQA